MAEKKRREAGWGEGAAGLERSGSGVLGGGDAAPRRSERARSAAHAQASLKTRAACAAPNKPTRARTAHSHTHAPTASCTRTPARTALALGRRFKDPKEEEMADGVQGYLVVTVVEASGKSRDDTYVWDDATKEGYVKGEREEKRES